MEEAWDKAARVDRGRTKRPFWVAAVAARDKGTRGTGIEEEKVGRRVGGGRENRADPNRRNYTRRQASER
jgi:hypothetical protein